MRRILLMIALCGISIAQAGEIPPGAPIFIPPMQNGMDKFIAAEILQQQVPFVMTLDEKQADYILLGSTIDKGSNRKWFDVAFGTEGHGDSVQASVLLLRKRDKIILWANNQGDRSFWWGDLKRGGERKVAIRLVRALKKSLFAPRKALRTHRR